MRKALPYILIIIVSLIAGAIYLQATGRSGSTLLGSRDNGNPQVSATDGTATTIPFKNYGPAPEFANIEKWLNAEPIKMADLKGKVVLVDFWTYSCINCIRTLPHVTQWYDTYKDQGLVVIGVHTPEFAFERVTENVETAIKRFNINYPVAQDNSYGTWRAYNNQFWPAHYLIDRDGKIVYTHFGEGNYDITEKAIRQLIGLPGGVEAGEGPDPNAKKVKSPEMYFGLSRLEYMANPEKPVNQEQVYTLPQNQLKLNTYALEGTWKLENEKAILTQGYGRIRLSFNAGKVHMVASSIKPVTLKITVDGKAQSSITVQASDLYTLFDSDQYRGHVIEIEIPQPGFEAFTFTFG